MPRSRAAKSYALCAIVSSSREEFALLAKLNFRRHRDKNSIVSGKDIFQAGYVEEVAFNNR